jgi:prevent-host-death family protein
MQVNMLDAKTKLSQLVDAAEHGEEILIARNGVPVAQIVPLKKQTLNFGFLKGKIGPISDSLLFAMSEAEADHLVSGEN